MAYGDIPDLVFTTDANGNVIYSNGTTTPTTGTTGTTSTDKKWWESLIGTIPALATAIFGNKQTNVPIYTPTTGVNTGANNSMMMIVIVAAVLVLFLLMQKRK